MSTKPTLPAPEPAPPTAGRGPGRPSVAGRRGRARTAAPRPRPPPGSAGTAPARHAPPPAFGLSQGSAGSCANRQADARGPLQLRPAAGRPARTAIAASRDLVHRHGVVERSGDVARVVGGAPGRRRRRGEVV